MADLLADSRHIPLNLNWRGAVFLGLYQMTTPYKRHETLRTQKSSPQPGKTGFCIFFEQYLKQHKGQYREYQ